MLRLRAAVLRNFLSVIGDVEEGADIPTTSRGTWAPLRQVSPSVPEAFPRQVSGWDRGGGAQAPSLPHPGRAPVLPACGAEGHAR